MCVRDKGKIPKRTGEQHGLLSDGFPWRKSLGKLNKHKGVRKSISRVGEDPEDFHVIELKRLILPLLTFVFP